MTTFKFKTYPAPKTGINWAWRWTLDNNAEDTVDKKVKIFQAMQDYAVTAPSNMALRMFTMPMYGGYEVSGVYWGSLADFNATIAPLVNNLPQDGISDVREYGFLELLVVLAGSVPLPQPENYTEHNTFVSLPPPPPSSLLSIRVRAVVLKKPQFTKSIVSPTKLNSEALTSFFKFHGENADKPPLSWWVLADLYGGQYSEISAQDSAGSSYYVRDSFFTFQLYSDLGGATGTYPDWGFELMGELSRSLTDKQPETKFHAYPNYVDPTLSPEEAHDLYYGTNYPRLKQLKGVYDPTLLLWNPQAIGTS